jgi:hypothetical protein
MMKKSNRGIPHFLQVFLIGGQKNTEKPFWQQLQGE